MEGRGGAWGRLAAMRGAGGALGLLAAVALVLAAPCAAWGTLAAAARRAAAGEKFEKFDWGWSDAQGRLLTGGGKAVPEAYGPFAPADLPHHHLERGTWREAYERLSARGTGQSVAVGGAWARSLFAGAGGEADFASRVVDIQTPGGAFADIRIPPGRAKWSGMPPRRTLKPEEQLEIYGPDYLRALARQHAFAGVTAMDGEHATRHHVVDWNPAPRRTPNRFRVEPHPDGQSWVEMCNATDDRGYSVYVERWERLPGSGEGQEQYLALHRAPEAGARAGGGREALLVVAGDHFLRVVQRAEPLPNFGDSKATPNTASLADGAWQREDQKSAASLISVDAAYGRISERGWVVELATLPWREGRELWLEEGREEETAGGAPAGPFVTLDGGDRWEVLENSFSGKDFAQMLQRMGRAHPEQQDRAGGGGGAEEAGLEQQQEDLLAGVGVEGEAEGNEGPEDAEL